jgi:hypothetical protein
MAIRMSRGLVEYNVLLSILGTTSLVTHEVTNSGSGRSQLAKMAIQAQSALDVIDLQAIADHGYFKRRRDSEVPRGRHCHSEIKRVTISIPG